MATNLQLERHVSCLFQTIYREMRVGTVQLTSLNKIQQKVYGQRIANHTHKLNDVRINYRAFYSEAN